MTFQALLQGFFVDRLGRQRHASAHTIAAYRDTFRLLLRFAVGHLHQPPSRLSIEDISVSFVAAFLDHLERERGNSARTRNARLAAIHSFFHYVALMEPAHALLCQRVLAIPNKRFERGPVEFLAPDEIDALLAAPHTSTWIGRRDRALLLVAIQTGLRVAELISLRREEVILGNGAHVRCQGKGRKARHTPLRRDVARVLDAWLREQPPADLPMPVFPSSRGGPLSRDAVERVIDRHLETARKTCASLKGKNITPHTLRHTAAMELLRCGVDRSVIALWLGHESMETTQIYLHADMRMKEQALARTTNSRAVPARYRPKDDLLAFLEGL
jgi:site-specific recombinase XerD